jgi:hypothetical protein
MFLKELSLVTGVADSFKLQYIPPDKHYKIKKNYYCVQPIIYKILNLV